MLPGHPHRRDRARDIQVTLRRRPRGSRGNVARSCYELKLFGRGASAPRDMAAALHAIGQVLWGYLSAHPSARLLRLLTAVGVALAGALGWGRRYGARVCVSSVSGAWLRELAIESIKPGWLRHGGRDLPMTLRLVPLLMLMVVLVAPSAGSAPVRDLLGLYACEGLAPKCKRPTFRPALRRVHTVGADRQHQDCLPATRARPEWPGRRRRTREEARPHRQWRHTSR